MVEKVDSPIVKGQCRVIDRVAWALLNIRIISTIVEQVTNYQLPITDYQLPITNYQLPITNYQLPLSLQQFGKP
ncbi:hypothetical protein [Moorena sp. SIO1G6]|uniref:hypothetical protein n=1 Tax=Moorena sp. SIO1G6 TaxID=2607840 RepID=UPI00257A9AEF|nr:hypothetical protein [Moorena sp. SIO1G6]